SIFDVYRASIFTIKLDHGIEKSFTTEELGIYYNSGKTLDKIPVQKNRIIQLFLPNASAENEADHNVIQPVIDINEKRLYQQISKYMNAHESEPQNAKIVWELQEWSVVPEKSGETIKKGEIERVVAVIVEESYSIEEDTTIKVAYQTVEPILLSDDLTELKESVDMLADTPILIQFGDQEEEILLSEDPDWLDINEKASSFSLSEAKAESWIEDYAKQYDKEAGQVIITGWEEIESEYDHELFKKALYEGSFESGLKINQEAFLSDLESMIENPTEERVINVIADPVSPSVASDIEGVSFDDLLGTGRSSYELGNSEDRVKNITLSLDAFGAVVVAPGEEFSMNRTTGWITLDKGYKKTKVIYGGAVAAGIGGGVCQTSTTLYRAVVNAGLEVTERRPHSLDVSYYHKYGYGVDAAVYTASRKDFKFINDTDNYILMNTYITEDEEAFVEIYGTSDDREVELENIETGVWNYKKWKWNVTINGELDERLIESRYLR
ncbi:MAG: hypothetical protein GWP15_00645, partial [Nitrospirae bacterium]|nr:hypothetical protein [Nitrospirota bacterium]